MNYTQARRVVTVLAAFKLPTGGCGASLAMTGGVFHLIFDDLCARERFVIKGLRSLRRITRNARVFQVCMRWIFKLF